MKAPRCRVFSFLFPFLWLALALVLSPLAQAAPIPASDAAYTGSFTAGTPENITGNAALAGITTTSGTFTSLTGAVANSVVTTNAVSSLGTAPADANAAGTGLTTNDGINNLASGNFQFGLGFTANTRFFILESALTSGPLGDATVITLIDASNNQVGTFSLSLLASDFTSSPANNTSGALATLTYTSGQASVVGVQSKLGAATFSLADFIGTGNIALATGIRLTSGTLDPNVVGLYAVPEPGSWMLMLFGCVGLIAWHRLRLNHG